MESRTEAYEKCMVYKSTLILCVMSLFTCVQAMMVNFISEKGNTDRKRQLAFLEFVETLISKLISEWKATKNAHLSQMFKFFVRIYEDIKEDSSGFSILSFGDDGTIMVLDEDFPGTGEEWLNYIHCLSHSQVRLTSLTIMIPSDREFFDMFIKGYTKFLTEDMTVKPDFVKEISEAYLTILLHPVDELVNEEFRDNYKAIEHIIPGCRILSSQDFSALFSDV
jgi:hypothetical protein